MVIGLKVDEHRAIPLELDYKSLPAVFGLPDLPTVVNDTNSCSLKPSG
jgi:hypothetical protein